MHSIFSRCLSFASLLLLTFIPVKTAKQQIAKMIVAILFLILLETPLHDSKHNAPMSPALFHDPDGKRYSTEIPGSLLILRPAVRPLIQTVKQPCDPKGCCVLKARQQYTKS